MKFVIVFICIFLATDTIWAMSLSNDVLDELETLIKTYEGSENTKDKTIDSNTKKGTLAPGVKETENEYGLRIVEAEHARSCSIVSRAAYKECNDKATNDDQKIECAYLFVEKYKQCYFGSTLVQGSKDLHVCTGSCNWNFDHCLVNSNKVEMFICINGRNACFQQCPWSNEVQNRKRMLRNKQPCHNDCEGYFDQCMYVIKHVLEISICQGNRRSCRKRC